jgi:hypothetical protein
MGNERGAFRLVGCAVVCSSAGCCSDRRNPPCPGAPRVSKKAKAKSQFQNKIGSASDEALGMPSEKPHEGGWLADGKKKGG